MRMTLNLSIIGDERLVNCFRLWIEREKTCQIVDQDADILLVEHSVDEASFQIPIIRYINTPSITYNVVLDDLVFADAEEELEWIKVCRTVGSQNPVIPIDLDGTLRCLGSGMTIFEPSRSLLDTGFLNLIERIKQDIKPDVQLRLDSLAALENYDVSSVQNVIEKCIRYYVQHQTIKGMNDVLQATSQGFHQQVIRFGRICQTSEMKSIDAEFEKLHGLAQVVLMSFQYISELISDDGFNIVLSLLLKKASVDTLALYGLLLVEEDNHHSPHLHPLNLLYYIETIQAHLPESLDRFIGSILKHIDRCLRHDADLESYLDLLEHIKTISFNHMTLSKLIFGWLAMKIRQSNSAQLYEMRTLLSKQECIAADYLITMIDPDLETCQCWPDRDLIDQSVRRMIELL